VKEINHSTLLITRRKKRAMSAAEINPSSATLAKDKQSRTAPKLKTAKRRRAFETMEITYTHLPATTPVFTLCPIGTFSCHRFAPRE
jgi:hypothetical protein